jgi:hypothetical protein
MKVLIAFKFEGVEPDSPEADRIIEEMTEECETMGIAFDANNCWVDDAVAHQDEDEGDDE